MMKLQPHANSASWSRDTGSSQCQHVTRPCLHASRPPASTLYLDSCSTSTQAAREFRHNLPRNVIAFGRRRKSESVFDEPPLPSPPPAAKRGRPPKQKSPTPQDGVDHSGLLSIDMSDPGGSSHRLTTVNDPLDLHTELPMEVETDQQLYFQPGQGVDTMQPAVPTTTTTTTTTAVTQRTDEQGGYGITSGLADNGYEKTMLREQVGYDLYHHMQPVTSEDTSLPKKYAPIYGTAREMAKLQFNLTREYWLKRQLHQEYIHELGWMAHHHTRENSVNIYANTRRVAGLMSAFEDDDFKLQNLAPSHLAPWARSELVFYGEHQEFNANLEEHIMEAVKRPLKEAEEEELDMLDEALFLLRPDDDMVSASRTNQQSAEQDLVQQYLEGMLPGATLDNLAATYAEDIFDGDMDDYFDDDAMVNKLGDDDQVEEEEETAITPAATTTSRGKRSSKANVADDLE